MNFADIYLKKYEKAKHIRLQFEDLYDEIFEYCLPQRQGFKTIRWAKTR